MLKYNIKWFAVVTALFLIAHCANESTAKRSLSGDLNLNPKIGPTLRRVISDLHESGKTETQVSNEKNARIDKNGNIQCYVYCKRINPQTITAIKEKSANIDLVNKKSGIIQGWISSKNILRLAELDNVVSITLPDYAETLR